MTEYTIPVYAIGIEEQPNSFGMIYGPKPNLNDALVFPGGDDAVLFRFNPDGTNDRLYRWREGAWREYDDGELPRG